MCSEPRLMTPPVMLKLSFSNCGDSLFRHHQIHSHIRHFHRDLIRFLHIKSDQDLQCIWGNAFKKAVIIPLSMAAASAPLVKYYTGNKHNIDFLRGDDRGSFQYWFPYAESPPAPGLRIIQGRKDCLHDPVTITQWKTHSLSLFSKDLIDLVQIRFNRRCRVGKDSLRLPQGRDDRNNGITQRN